MPGWAGSSWYWMRYMDAQNPNEFASSEAIKYWESVDLYIGGSEHATGHLLYSRFWNKFLKDKGLAPTEEPFKKLINQGMILGNSAYIEKIYKYTVKFGKSILDQDSLDNSSIVEEVFEFAISDKLVNYKDDIYSVISQRRIELGFDSSSNDKDEDRKFREFRIPISYINDITNELNVDAIKNDFTDLKDIIFIKDKDKFIVSRVVEKMSKRWGNVVNPEDICNEYGADTLRLYEMFLGPLEQSKPWNTAGITGVYGFLKKLWRLYFDDNGLIVTDETPSPEMLKSLHKTIKKVTEDIENFSFNTSVSQFMICVNELTQLKCHHRAILEPLAVLISPYAPHIAEELWAALHFKDLKIEGLKDYQGVSTVAFPVFEPKYLVESEKEYPVSFNGKMRFTIKLPLDLSAAEIESIVMQDERTQAQLQGKTPNKVIIVPGKIINLVG